MSSSAKRKRVKSAQRPLAIAQAYHPGLVRQVGIVGILAHLLAELRQTLEVTVNLCSTGLVGLGFGGPPQGPETLSQAVTGVAVKGVLRQRLAKQSLGGAELALFLGQTSPFNQRGHRRRIARQEFVQEVLGFSNLPPQMPATRQAQKEDGSVRLLCQQLLEQFGSFLVFAGVGAA